jgi:hypothetical protein
MAYVAELEMLEVNEQKHSEALNPWKETEAWWYSYKV